MSKTKINAILDLANQIAETTIEEYSSPTLIELKHFLNDFIEFGNKTNLGAPAIISLIGGTGVGKSFLFSKLVGIPEISPSSSSVRGFTKNLYVSCFKEQQHFFPITENATFCPGILSSCILVDSPDLDTILEKNRSLTQHLIKHSDLIIYVTTPDKRSNFDVQNDLIEWSERKRWFFVLNKIDTAVDVSHEQLKKDFDLCLNKFGFSPTDNNRFLLNSREANSFEFQRLKDTIFSHRTKETVESIKFQSIISHISYELENSNLIKDLLRLHKNFKDETNRQVEKRLELQKEIVSDENFEVLWQTHISNTIWTQLKQTRSLFMYPFIFWHSYFSESISQQTLLSKFQDLFNSSDKKKALDLDSKRIIEDNAMAFPRNESDNSSFKISEPIFSSSNFNLKDSKATSIYLFLGNLLPMIFFYQIVQRTFFKWLNGSWLPYDFFIHGFILIFLSSIPGYFLLTYLINRKASSIRVKLSEEVQIPQDLLKIENELSSLSNQISNLSVLVNSNKETLD